MLDRVSENSNWYFRFSDYRRFDKLSGGETPPTPPVATALISSIIPIIANMSSIILLTVRLYVYAPSVPRKNLPKKTLIPLRLILSKEGILQISLKKR